MGNKTEVIAFAALACCLALSLSACGSSSGSQQNNASGTTSQQSTASTNQSTTSTAKKDVTADRLISIDSVETHPEKHYTKDYVAYALDITVTNVSDGSLVQKGTTITDVTLDNLTVQFLDADGNIVDSGHAHMSGTSDPVTLSPGQSATFQVTVHTGKNISQVKFMKANLGISKEDTTDLAFADPNSLVYPVASPAGTVD